MWCDKIDASVFDVYISKSRENACLVYTNELLMCKKMMDKWGIDVKNEYPFINAFCIERTGLFNLVNLANLNMVDYISSVNTAETLLNSVRKTVKVDFLHKQKLSGRGVGVAVIDTGCYPHLDFLLSPNRKITFVDLINQHNMIYDDNGHGTFVCGVLGGSGLSSGGVYRGVAPQSDLVIIKALDRCGKTQGVKILDAMQWIVRHKQKYNIRVVCMSFGSEPSSQFDALSLGANSLWDNGIVVVSAVGNDGPRVGSVKSPAISSKIISVGAIDTTISPPRVASFSSRGPIFDVVKPDVVAPGVDITSLDNSPQLFTTMSGTSVSTPTVAGLCALLIECQPTLSPNDVKAILIGNANSIGAEVNQQGSGVVDAEKCWLSIKNDKDSLD